MAVQLAALSNYFKLYYATVLTVLGSYEMNSTRYLPTIFLIVSLATIVASCRNTTDSANRDNQADKGEFIFLQKTERISSTRELCSLYTKIENQTRFNPFAKTKRTIQLQEKLYDQFGSSQLELTGEVQRVVQGIMQSPGELWLGTYSPGVTEYTSSLKDAMSLRMDCLGDVADTASIVLAVESVNRLFAYDSEWVACRCINNEQLRVLENVDKGDSITISGTLEAVGNDMPRSCYLRLRDCIFTVPTKLPE